MAEPGRLRIEVACALAERQRLVSLDVPPGTTAREAVELAGLAPHFPELDLPACQLGIFGRPVADGQRLAAGDRVEVYRPLERDPRDARRALAARGLTMGHAPPRGRD